MNIAPAIKQLRVLADKLERGEYVLTEHSTHFDWKWGKPTGRATITIGVYVPAEDRTAKQTSYTEGAIAASRRRLI